MKRAFTTAEILIALLIIGIVAAMTLPTLIQKHTNTVVAKKIEKFYFAINNAVELAEIKYGDKKLWYEKTEDTETFCNKYLIPYLKVLKTDTINNKFTIYLADGSVFSADSNTQNWFFYTKDPEKCNDSIGVCSFAFSFYPIEDTTDWEYHYNNGFEPYKYQWDGTVDSSVCSDSKYYCTAIIQMNGWKIPDDYPYKVKT